MFSKVIYECDLHSITPDILIKRKFKRRDNIENAYTKVVSKIMVRPTFIKNIYREIITGKKIPAYRLIYYKNKSFYKVQIPSSPVFIKVEEEIGSEYTNNLKLAEEPDIKKYMQKNESKKDLKEYLDSIFKQGEEYYENALSESILKIKLKKL